MPFKSAREPARHRGSSRCGLRRQGARPRCSVRAGPRRALPGTCCRLNSTVSADGFEAKWQTTEFGSPRIAAASAIAEPSMWNTPMHRRRSHPGDADLPHDQSRGEIRPAIHGAVVRDLFFFEVLSRLRIHVVQYGLLGLSLSLFSLLLLSLAEPIGYTNGYLVAAGLVLVAIDALYRGGRAALHAGDPVRPDAREPVRASSTCCSGSKPIRC